MSQGIEKGMTRVKYKSKPNWDFIVFEKKKEKQALNLKCIRTYLKHILFIVLIKASVLGHVLNKHTRG